MNPTPNRRPHYLWLLCCAALLGLLGTAAAATPEFPLGALEPGARGYGLSAGSGNRIERFEVEVLALQYDVGTGFPLVLVRASGPPIAAAGGIASGMSGSPVYLRRGGQDALLGAIGYTFPESSGGLGLVTPIGTMKRADPRRSDLEANPAPTAAARPAPAFGPTFSVRDAAPVRTPLLLSGLSAQASDLLRPLFADAVTPIPLQSRGPGGRNPDLAAADAAYTLRPGSAVSVQLVRGDITVAAVGTVTLLEAGAFWAFGHPLLGGGPVSFALAPAYVTATVPSRNVPFKLADSGQRVLGSITQDRPYALSGLLGADPDFIPVTLSLSGDAGSATKRFEITRDERFYAPLLAAGVLQSLTEQVQATGAGTADLAWEIELRGGRTLNLLEQITDPENLELAAARLAGEPLAELADNPFQAAEIVSVALSLSYRQRERVADLVEVVPERRRLRAGDTLGLNVRLQPYRQGPEVESLRVSLPPALRGRVVLSVRGGLTPPDLAGRDGAQGEAPPLYSFAELLSALENNVQASELVVEAVIGGERLLLERRSLPYLVVGAETVAVTVGKAAPNAPPAPPRETPPEDEPAPPPDSDPLDERPPLEPSLDFGHESQSP